MNTIQNLRQRYRYSLILLRQLVKTDFKLRYQGSALGYTWSLLKPGLLFLILYVVFSIFLRVGDTVEHFAVYLLLGIVIWTFFAEATGLSLSSIVGRGDILRKINFPKYIVVMSVNFSALINLGINLLVVFVFMTFNQIDLRWEGLLAPLILLQLFAIAMAISFFLSAFYVRFRDVSHIWEVILQGAFYGTPILYPLQTVPETVQKLLLLNPMAQVIQDIRYVLITPDAITIDQAFGTHWARAITYGLTLLVAVYASWYFRTRSKYFAEEL